MFGFWPGSNGNNRLGRLVYRRNKEFDEQSVGKAPREGSDDSAEGPSRALCHVWSVDAESPNDSYQSADGQEIQEQGHILVKLPDLEPYQLPALSTEQDGEATKIVKIAGLDNVLVGLTNKGHVVKFKGLDSAETAQRQSANWDYVSS